MRMRYLMLPLLALLTATPALGAPESTMVQGPNFTGTFDPGLLSPAKSGGVYQVVGRVFADYHGKTMAAAGSLVIAKNEEGKPVSSCRVRPDGTYVLPLAKPGRYLVTLYQPFLKDAGLSDWSPEYAFVEVRPAKTTAAITRSFEDQVLNHSKQSFANADKNHDFKLSVTEAGLMGMAPNEFPGWDKNRDGGLTFEELMAGGMVKASIQQLRKIADSALKVYDLDGDHMLSLSEYTTANLSFHLYTSGATPKADTDFKLAAFQRNAGEVGKLTKANLERLFGDSLERGYSIDYNPIAKK